VECLVKIRLGRYVSAGQVSGRWTKTIVVSIQYRCNIERNDTGCIGPYLRSYWGPTFNETIQGVSVRIPQVCLKSKESNLETLGLCTNLMLKKQLGKEFLMLRPKNYKGFLPWCSPLINCRSKETI